MTIQLSIISDTLYIKFISNTGYPTGANVFICYSENGEKCSDWDNLTNYYPFQYIHPTLTNTVEYNVRIDETIIFNTGKKFTYDMQCYVYLSEPETVRTKYAVSDFFTIQPKNLLRLGYSESQILFLYYLDSIHVDKCIYLDEQTSLVNWLYSTSGFYDKTIVGDYFNFKLTDILQSNAYNIYFKNLLHMIQCNDKKFNLHLSFGWHVSRKELQPYLENFKTYINYTTPTNFDINVMHNKDVLIINNLGKLMKQQYESGNTQKIFPNFPNVKSIQYLEPGYTFLNNGPDSNILETATNICKKIDTYTFDVAIISVGAYGNILFNHVILQNKFAYVVGGIISYKFGISTKRVPCTSEYAINVPPEYRPVHYEKIEEGCYW